MNRRALALLPMLASCSAAQGDPPQAAGDAMPAQYRRAPEQTYLTLPEWFILYSSDEYANFIADKPPSGFPYLSSIGQFWSYYGHVYGITKGRYPFNTGYHVMSMVIGASMSVEYTVKFAYENTIGRASETLRTHGPTEEDQFAAQTAKEYVEFIRLHPWYEYDFAHKLGELWRQTSYTGHDMARKWERKFALSLEYGVKTGYGWVIKELTGAAYDEESPVTAAVTGAVPDALLARQPDIKPLKRLDDGHLLITLPRYEPFTHYATLLADHGIPFFQIAGNGEIMLSVLAPQQWAYNLAAGAMLFEKPVLTQPELKRVMIQAPVTALSGMILQLQQQHIALEHIYDY